MSIPPEIFYVLGAAALGVALAYGMLQSRKRNKANDPISDKASRELYNNPENYDEKEKELRKEIKPS